MVERYRKPKDRTWWMLFLAPAALIVSGWQGLAGLLLGWLAVTVGFRLLISIIGKDMKDGIIQEAAKSVLLRLLIIVTAMILSGVVGGTAVYWTGGGILLGQGLMIYSVGIAARRWGGDGDGRD